MHLNLRQKIIFLNTSLPQRCGFAAFTSDLLYHKHQAVEKILADGQGVPVPSGGSQRMADAIRMLLSNESSLNRMIQRAYEYGRSTAWRIAGRAYRNILRAGKPFSHTSVRTRLSMQISTDAVDDLMQTPANTSKRANSLEDSCL